MSEPTSIQGGAGLGPLPGMIGSQDAATIQAQTKAEGKGILAADGNRQVESKPLQDSGQAERPNLPAPAPLNTTALQSGSTRLGELTQSPSMSDMIMMVAAMAYKQNTEMRDISQQSSRSMLKAQVSELNSQADHMKSAAKAAFVGGLVMGIVSIGAAGVGFVGGYKGFKAAKTSANNLNLADSRLMAQQTKWSSTSQGIGSLGKIADSGGNLGAGQHQAEGKQDEARAAEAGANRDEMLKFRDNMQDNMRATLQIIQQVMDSRKDTTSRIFA